jgi:S-adenosyl-L-methionine hydrolase (adenosine-forming)
MISLVFLEFSTMTTPIVTLTTDFGAGPYVAQMKGIILGYESKVQFVDVTHEIAPQGIRQAAIVLGDVVPSFPAKTIHLVVVDPGVGSDRAILYVEAGEWRFVLPDNGLISAVADAYPIHQVIQLTKTEFFSPRISPTFHGRDIMSHIIGHLLRGADPTAMGIITDSIVKLCLPQPTASQENCLLGEILFVDHFGNAISNLRRERLLQEFGQDCLLNGSIKVSIDGRPQQLPFCRNYAQLNSGELVSLFDSQGRLELAVVNGNAAVEYGISEKSRLRVSLQ